MDPTGSDSPMDSGVTMLDDYSYAGWKLNRTRTGYRLRQVVEVQSDLAQHVEGQTKMNR